MNAPSPSTRALIEYLSGNPDVAADIRNEITLHPESPSEAVLLRKLRGIVAARTPQELEALQSALSQRPDLVHVSVWLLRQGRTL